MKILKFTAPSYSDADIWYCKEKDWHTVLDVFESRVDELDINEKLNFEVEILELTDEQWKNIQLDFIEE